MQLSEVRAAAASFEAAYDAERRMGEVWDAAVQQANLELSGAGPPSQDRGHFTYDDCSYAVVWIRPGFDGGAYANGDFLRLPESPRHIQEIASRADLERRLREWRTASSELSIQLRLLEASECQDDRDVIAKFGALAPWREEIEHCRETAALMARVRKMVAATEKKATAVAA